MVRPQQPRQRHPVLVGVAATAIAAAAAAAVLAVARVQAQTGATTGSSSTGIASTGIASTTGVPTTGLATTGLATTGIATTGIATTGAATTGAATTGAATTGAATTGVATTGAATTGVATTGFAATGWQSWPPDGVHLGRGDRATEVLVSWQVAPSAAAVAAGGALPAALRCDALSEPQWRLNASSAWVPGAVTARFCGYNTSDAAQAWAGGTLSHGALDVRESFRAAAEAGWPTDHPATFGHNVEFRVGPRGDPDDSHFSRPARVWVMPDDPPFDAPPPTFVLGTGSSTAASAVATTGAASTAGGSGSGSNSSHSTLPPRPLYPASLDTREELGMWVVSELEFDGSVTNLILAQMSSLAIWDLGLVAGGFAAAAGATPETIWDNLLDAMDTNVLEAGGNRFFVTPGARDLERGPTPMEAHFQTPTRPGPGAFGPVATGGQLWYSFDHGPLHILSISAQADFAPGSAQHEYARADLARAATSSQRWAHPWLIVSIDTPLYSSCLDVVAESNATVRDVFEPLFEEFGVDFVIQGGQDHYERTSPLRNATAQPLIGNGTVDSPLELLDETAPVYFVTGTGGFGAKDPCAATGGAGAPPWRERELSGNPLGYGGLIFRFKPSNSSVELFFGNVNGVSDQITYSKPEYLYVPPPPPPATTGAEAASDEEPAEEPFPLGLVLGLVFGIVCCFIVLAVGAAWYLQRRREKERERARAEARAAAHGSDDGSYDDDMEGGVPLRRRGTSRFINRDDQTPVQVEEVLAERDGRTPKEIFEACGATQLTDVTMQKRLGAGAFGEVWQARWHGSKVALKCLMIKSGVDGEDALTDFLSEFRFMMDLNHPNVVRFLGVALQEGVDDSAVAHQMDVQPDMFLVTEFCPRGSLKDCLDKRAIDTSAGALSRYVYEMACGLEYMAEREVSHNDLAARNCLVSGDLMVKIADFGLSSASNAAQAASMVPVRWTAPEVLLEGVPIFVKSDVYSFGNTSFEILEKGRLPWHWIATNKEVMDHVTKGEKMHQPALCPDPVFALLTRCWAFNPDDRPTFKEIRSELEALFLGPHAGDTVFPDGSTYGGKDRESKMRHGRGGRTATSSGTVTPSGAAARGASVAASASASAAGGAPAGDSTRRVESEREDEYSTVMNAGAAGATVNVRVETEREDEYTTVTSNATPSYSSAAAASPAAAAAAGDGATPSYTSVAGATSGSGSGGSGPDTPSYSSPPASDSAAAAAIEEGRYTAVDELAPVDSPSYTTAMRSGGASAGDGGTGQPQGEDESQYTELRAPAAAAGVTSTTSSASSAAADETAAREHAYSTLAVDLSPSAAATPAAAPVTETAYAQFDFGPDDDGARPTAAAGAAAAAADKAGKKAKKDKAAKRAKKEKKARKAARAAIREARAAGRDVDAHLYEASGMAPPSPGPGGVATPAAPVGTAAATPAVNEALYGKTQATVGDEALYGKTPAAQPKEPDANALYGKTAASLGQESSSASAPKAAGGETEGLYGHAAAARSTAASAAPSTEGLYGHAAASRSAQSASTEGLYGKTARQAEPEVEDGYVAAARPAEDDSSSSDSGR